MLLIALLVFAFSPMKAFSQVSLINDVTFNTSQQYRSGDTLTVTMRGEPGCAATFDVGQLTGIPMNEVSAGIYSGSYLIPAGTTLMNAQIVGHLQKGSQVDSQAAPVTLSTMMVSNDINAAVVTEIRSSHKESYVTTKPPYIFIKHDRIDYYTMHNLKVYVDGKDVTAFSTITERSTSYAPPVPFSLGGHNVVLVGVNSVGAQFRSNTWFKVEAAGMPVSSSLTPIAMVTTQNGTITAVPVNALWQSSLNSIQIFDNLTSPAHRHNIVTVTLLGPPQGVATFDVGTTTGIPMTEKSPGAYVGIYTVQHDDSFNSAILTGHLALRTGQNLIASSPTINSMAYNNGGINMSGSPLVTILSPANGDRLTPPFTISGTAPPNTDVILSIQAPDGTRQTLVVRADANGNFQATMPLAQTEPGTQYIITAIPRDSYGNLGSSSTITVVQQR